MPFTFVSKRSVVNQTSAAFRGWANIALLTSVIAIGCTQVSEPTCAAGAEGCACDAAGSCEQGLACSDGYCLAELNACPAGREGCQCRGPEANRPCAAGLLCESGMCVQASQETGRGGRGSMSAGDEPVTEECSRGQEGCECRGPDANRPCATGLSCESGVCVSADAEPETSEPSLETPDSAAPDPGSPEPAGGPDAAPEMEVPDEVVAPPETSVGVDAEVPPDEAVCGPCTGRTPVCDPSTGTCVECLVSSDCEAELPVCDTVNHVCADRFAGRWSVSSGTETWTCDDGSPPETEEASGSVEISRISPSSISVDRSLVANSDDCIVTFDVAGDTATLVPRSCTENVPLVDLTRYMDFDTWTMVSEDGLTMTLTSSHSIRVSADPLECTLEEDEVLTRVWPDPAQLAWTCDEEWLGTGDGCDCGCGGIDPDCDSASVESCDYCWPAEAGGCNLDDDTCPGTINPEDNSKCAG
jgi:hypothetical protein